MTIKFSKFRNLSLFLSILVGIFVSTSVFAGNKPKPNIIGPTGCVGLYQPSWPKVAVEIKVTSVEEGSPASAAGIKAGDVIVGLGSETFKNHPMGDITEAFDVAEAEGKTLDLLLKRGKQVSLKLATLGTYSPTAPYNCPKTDKIIQQTAERIRNDVRENKFKLTPTKTALLGLMATGEKKNIELVGQLIKESEMLNVDPKQVEALLNGEKVTTGLGLISGVTTGWGWGYSLITLGEYYLLTKDESVLPAMRAYAIGLARGQDGVGCWGHNMGRFGRGRAPGYGTMNQPTISNLMGMIIARKCGIKAPVFDKALAKTYATIENVAGKGGFAYGSGGIYPNFYNNNGTSGSAAICLSLKGNQKGASFFSQCAATTYESLTSGHASAFFNPLWTPLGASLSGPEVTHQFFMKSLWYFNDHRHWKGGFPEIENAGAVAGQALLMYCIPRKALLITGREADESIFVKGTEATHVIMRSKIDYKAKKVSELFNMRNDIVQVRMAVIKELSDRLSKSYQFNRNGKNEIVSPKILSLLKSGNEKDRIFALNLLDKAPAEVILPQLNQLVDIIRNKEDAFAVRVAAVSALSNSKLDKAALPYFNDILKFTLEKRSKADPFGEEDETIATALDGMLKLINTPETQKEHGVDKTLVYEVANQLLEHRRQNVRNIGMRMLKGIPLADFHLVAKNLKHVLDDTDRNYSTYSSTINSDGISILADLNIKEGLDYLVDGIFHRGGKWGFKYSSLIRTLPLYGANAKPYIEKFEAHKDINKPGDRFTPAWQAAVKKINEDKHPKKLMSIEDVLRASKAK